jgi:hypothetical protein
MFSRILRTDKREAGFVLPPTIVVPVGDTPPSAVDIAQTALHTPPNTTDPIDGEIEEATKKVNQMNTAHKINAPDLLTFSVTGSGDLTNVREADRVDIEPLPTPAVPPAAFIEVEDTDSPTNGADIDLLSDEANIDPPEDNIGCELEPTPLEATETAPSPESVKVSSKTSIHASYIGIVIGSLVVVGLIVKKVFKEREIQESVERYLTTRPHSFNQLLKTRSTYIGLAGVVSLFVILKCRDRFAFLYTLPRA